MKAINYLAASLAAAAIGGAVALAPIASAAPPAAPTNSAPIGTAGTDPLVPFGTDPHSPYVFGYHVSDHDEANTTNGQLDVPF
ncbi:MAG TPA: hypothetical protein VE666_13985 [Mycobacterium sp.]|nr:hypothetical protein [Mycobacterium sp.]